VIIGSDVNNTTTSSSVSTSMPKVNEILSLPHYLLYTREAYRTATATCNRCSKTIVVLYSVEFREL
jgi:hypothetical protein